MISISKKKNCYFYCLHYNLQYPFYFATHVVDGRYYKKAGISNINCKFIHDYEKRCSGSTVGMWKGFEAGSLKKKKKHYTKWKGFED